MSTETDPSKIKKRKGKCRNFEGGECVKAEVGEIQEILSNELFVCQDCKQPLTEIASSNSKKALPFIIAGGGVILLGLLWFAFRASSPPPTPKVETSQLLVRGVVNQELKQRFDPGTAKSFDLSQSLPSGLKLDTESFHIQGTPTAAGETLLTIKGSNDEGKLVVEFEVTISVSGAAAPTTTSSNSGSSSSSNGQGEQVVSPSGAIGEVFFEQGSSELKEKQREDIQEMVARLKGEVRDCNVVVVLGYASRDGEEAENKYLAEKRAKAVANELTAQGIPQKKVYRQSEGELNQGRVDRDLAQDRKVTVSVYRD